MDKTKLPKKLFFKKGQIRTIMFLKSPDIRLILRAVMGRSEQKIECKEPCPICKLLKEKQAARRAHYGQR